MSTHVLVVDDEPDLELLIQQKFRKQIRQKDLAFHFAGDGVEALEQLAAHAEIDVVMTDLNMPRMDGLTLLQRIQDLDRMLKVLVVSAYGDLSNIRCAMNRGAFDFVTKPIDFDDLRTTLDKTLEELKTLKQGLHLQQQLTALHRDLEIASQIQLSALPSTFPAFPDRSDFDLFATMLPALEVGGDFYDFFLIDDDHLGFTIGDVSGKGIGAALFMAITRTLLKATALQGLPADACVRHVNRVLHPESMARMFVTLVYGILDTGTGVVSYCNAGHNPPYVVRKNGETTPLPRMRSIGLCLKADFEYPVAQVQLQPGDGLFLYTDGVTEAVDPHRALFAETRLEETLQQTGGERPADMIRHALRAVNDFAQGAAQSDDITMLALHYLG